MAKKHTMNGNARAGERSRERGRETYIHIWGLTMCPTFWHTRDVSPTRHYERHPQQHPRITTNRQKEREGEGESERGREQERSAELSCSAGTRGTKTAFARARAREQEGEANAADSAHRGGCCRGTAGTARHTLTTNEDSGRDEPFQL